MNDETQKDRAPLTKEQQDKFMETCDHVGTHGPVSQSILVNLKELLIISSHVCMLCGKLFTNISPVAMPGPDMLTKPQDHKAKIIRPS